MNDRGRPRVCLDRGVAGVIRAAVDHALAHPVHFHGRHIRQSRNRAQRIAGQQHRELVQQVGVSAWRECREQAIGIGAELREPYVLDRARRHRGKNRLALGLVRRAVLAHEVFAHQRGHQPAGLPGRKDVGLFLVDENRCMAGEQGGAELGYLAHGHVFAHARQVGIGIGPECGHVDFVSGCVGHRRAQNLGAFMITPARRAPTSLRKIARCTT